MLKAYRWQYIVSGVQDERFQRLRGEKITEAQMQRIGTALAPILPQGLRSRRLRTGPSGERGHPRRMTGAAAVTTSFLIYGANGYVGEAASRLAVARGLRPILAGRNAASLKPLSGALGVEFRACGLDDAPSIDRALRDVAVVLHCAGPYKFTSKPMADACLRAGVHYLDLTGEIPVFEALAARDAEAKARQVMLMPAVGFDVVPTDCLAMHLLRRLPSATRLELGFQSVGPAGLPPGTQRTMIELLPFGNRIRRGGQLVVPERGEKLRSIDFGQGPVEATRFTWGDVFTAYHSTGIPDIEVYAVLPPSIRRQMALTKALRPLLSLAPMRALLQRGVQPGPSARGARRHGDACLGPGHRPDRTQRGVSFARSGSRLGVDHARCPGCRSKSACRKHRAGLPDPGQVFGPDFVLECEGVSAKTSGNPASLDGRAGWLMHRRSFV